MAIGGVRRNQVAGAHIENFHGGRGGGEDLALAETRFVVGQGGFGGGDVFAPVAAFVFFQRGLGLVVPRFRSSDFLGAVAAAKLVEFVLGVLFLREGHFPVGFGGVALLLGDEVFGRQRVVSLKIEMRANFVGGGAVEVGFRCVDVFLAIAVSALLVFGFGLGGRGAHFGDFLRAVTAFGFQCGGAGLFERSEKLFVVEGDEKLAGFHACRLRGPGFCRCVHRFWIRLEYRALRRCRSLAGRCRDGTNPSNKQRLRQGRPRRRGLG